MRRALFVFLGLMLALTGCGGAAQQASQTAPPSKAPTATTAKAQGSESPTLAAIRKKGVLDYGWASWYPFAYRDPKTNQTTGIGIQVGKRLAAYLGVRFHPVQDHWNTIVGGLASDRFDLTIPLVNTPPRAKVIAFSDPMMRDAVTAVIRKADAAKYPNLKSLDRPGVRVMVTLGSAIDPVATKFFHHAKLIKIQDESTEPAALLANRADAIMNGNAPLTYVVQHFPALVMLPDTIHSQLIAFGMRKGDPVFAALINKWIAKVKGDGQLKGWIKRFGLTGSFFAP